MKIIIVIDFTEASAAAQTSPSSIFSPPPATDQSPGDAATPQSPLPESFHPVLPHPSAAGTPARTADATELADSFLELIRRAKDRLRAMNLLEQPPISALEHQYIQAQLAAWNQEADQEASQASSPPPPRPVESLACPQAIPPMPAPQLHFEHGTARPWSFSKSSLEALFRVVRNLP